MTLQTLITNELEQRDKFKHLVMDVILSRCSIGKGFVKRGHLSQYVYEEMGFHGRPGNDFFRFMNKVMAENGFRVSYSSGERVYYGLTWKEIQCQDQKESKKGSPESQDPES